ncbi:hypothetical protein NY2A_b721R [Paramecium bursaria Chlorella virus NY2A]|uniref:Uncharacterized protein b721R n=1 Tax=Paramecium bursaria Chlorella virus NY2A TaxID=46021 RepID=A7IXP6_PBCVN|nr:hypothetical protein NY2A_b721R [Paramecium bursaria Chlorella virus NY2A]YP_001498727.1 hypothetical protein AR158_c646R [Paramecium bursaria Chlorella virus AR158]ABT15120.1 hypothetical protein NY2A_b721R [Paramecium bursaria Chlorella virus NY2A]ABU44191.1 hypothetical protein AR158_c646R [Paramecium bursaria Chlorella virus AR158]
MTRSPPPGSFSTILSPRSVSAPGNLVALLVLSRSSPGIWMMKLVEGSSDILTVSRYFIMSSFSVFVGRLNITVLLITFAC